MRARKNERNAYVHTCHYVRYASEISDRFDVFFIFIFFVFVFFLFATHKMSHSSPRKKRFQYIGDSPFQEHHMGHIQSSCQALARNHGTCSHRDPCWQWGMAGCFWRWRNSQKGKGASAAHHRLPLGCAGSSEPPPEPGFGRPFWYSSTIKDVLIMVLTGLHSAAVQPIALPVVACRQNVLLLRRQRALSTPAALDRGVQFFGRRSVRRTAVIFDNRRLKNGRCGGLAVPSRNIFALWVGGQAATQLLL